MNTELAKEIIVLILAAIAIGVCSHLNDDSDDSLKSSPQTHHQPPSP
ncbi:hypothetical protein SAMN05660900_01300 [Megasphaera cerevisiae DSM 20462]|nr:hypothetical protein SAMN05660900_01300 [Megasphaera cerevisiae DSM 20462]